MTSQAEVVDTNTETPESSAAVENAQEPSLDSLLSEYEEPTETPETPEPPQVAPISPDIQSFMERQIKKDNDKAITDAADTIRNEVGETRLSAQWFEGQLHLEASKDPRLFAAFQNRESNPTKWNTVVKALAGKLKNDLAPVDEAATNSWNAVEASVRSASTSTPKETPAIDEKSLRNMSDADFEALRKEQGFKR